MLDSRLRSLARLRLHIIIDQPITVRAQTHHNRKHFRSNSTYKLIIFIENAYVKSLLKMKRCRRVRLKSTIIGKKGKTVIRTPLSVNNALRNHALQATVECANQPSSVQTDRNENILQLDACDSTDIVEDNIAITSNRRKIASSSNWAKIKKILCAWFVTSRWPVYVVNIVGQGSILTYFN